ncbi:MAG: hypothetical protein K4304_09040 [Propionicimonas sp.]
MSANTYVAKRLWLWCREVVAGLAGVAVSIVGASSVVANLRNDFVEHPSTSSGQVELVVTPVRGGALVQGPVGQGVVALSDPSIVDGLHPGESAYFGLTLSLRGVTGDAEVSLFPTASVVATEDLLYEVRSVSDPTQCRRSWDAGTVLVSPRTVADPARTSFRLAGEGPALPACIRVAHHKHAADVETGSVTWRFVAAAA